MNLRSASNGGVHANVSVRLGPACMMFVCHESHAHIWVFNVSLVYPDPPCSDGLFVGAFKTFRSWHFLDDTRFLAESQLVFLRGKCKISRKNISPLLVPKTGDCRYHWFLRYQGIVAQNSLSDRILFGLWSCSARTARSWPVFLLATAPAPGASTACAALDAVLEADVSLNISTS